jgi:hypothetical protein
MATSSQERTTTATTAPTTAGSTATRQPQVEVYDNDGTSTMGTTDPIVNTRTTLSDIDRDRALENRGGTNWGAIILGLIVIIALIWLLIWIF